MRSNSRAVENTWEMLKTLYKELKHKKFSTLDITSVQTIDDLYALV